MKQTKKLRNSLKFGNDVNIIVIVGSVVLSTVGFCMPILQFIFNYPLISFTAFIFMIFTAIMTFCISICLGICIVFLIKNRIFTTGCYYKIF